MGTSGKEVDVPICDHTLGKGHGEHPGYLIGYGTGSEAYEGFVPLPKLDATSEFGTAAMAELGTHTLGSGGACTEDDIATIKDYNEMSIYLIKEPTTSQPHITGG